MRGRLLVLEGPEGVGKTTQASALVGVLTRQLAGRVQAYREPGGTPLGDEIRALLLNPDEVRIEPRAEALLFMAARAQLACRIESQLTAGVTVVLDRFFLSTYAYQIVGRGLPAAEIRSANALAVGDLRPDLTVLLTCDLAVARSRMLARGDLDRMELEGVDFHERVTTAFLAAADPDWQKAHPEVGPVVRVEAAGSTGDVTARILAVLADRWPETFLPLAESQ
jgi:dTMP kinase